MGYSIHLEYEDLCCKTYEDAQNAVAIISADPWMHPYHLQVRAVTLLHPGPDLTPSLEVEHFQGDYWHDENASKVWLAIAPHMADGATIEFRDESGVNWRIRCEAGRVFEEFLTDVVWSDA